MDDREEERIIQYVLGELTSDDAFGVETLLKRNPQAKRFATEMRDVLGSVSLLAPPAPPPDLVDRVLARERETKVVAFPFLPWAVAAALAAALLVAGIDRYRLVSEVRDLRAAVSSSAWQIATLRSQLQEYRQATAVVLWNEKRTRGTIQLENLPPAGPGKDYQLWVVDGAAKETVNAGVVPVSSGNGRVDFAPVHPVTSAAKFVLSLEPAGGVPKSVGPAVLVSQ